MKKQSKKTADKIKLLEARLEKAEAEWERANAAWHRRQNAYLKANDVLWEADKECSRCRNDLATAKQVARKGQGR